jgi:hypothetical protein
MDEAGWGEWESGGRGEKLCNSVVKNDYPYYS